MTCSATPGGRWPRRCGAWVVAIVLALLGDRGVAVGVALAAGVGLSIAAGFVAVRWIDTNDWPLW